MIEFKDTLSMPEAKGYVKKGKDSENDILAFIKKFSSLNPKGAKEMRSKLEGLDLMKMNEKHVSKIIDFMPESSEVLNQIFVDIGLNEDETNKILETVKEFK